MESIVASQDRLHFFQYLEADLLQEYIRTGIHYFINAILNGYPQLIKFRYYSLQISTLIDFLKDLYSLVKHNATYSQNFYNFERKKPLVSKFSALKSALIWAIIPYLLTKLDNYYNKLIGQEIDGKKLTTFNKMIKVVYPYVYCVMNIIQVIYKFRYLYIHEDKEYYYNLMFKIDQTTLGHMKGVEEPRYPILEILKRPGILFMLIGHKVLTWHFNNKKQQKSLGKNEQKLEIKALIKDQDINEAGKCPICTKILKNATVVKLSGYVYCYNCISSQVKRQGKCPLSQITITQQNLQIIYN